MSNYLIIQQIVVSLQSFSEINDEEISFPNVFFIHFINGLIILLSI